MRITYSQREKLGDAEEELKGLSSLMEQIVDQNSDGTVEELRDLGTVWEMVLELSKHLKAIRQRKDS